MLTQELLVGIHVRHQQGESIRSIAKALNISRNTVRKQFRDAITVPTYSECAKKSSKLEPLKPYIQEMQWHSEFGHLIRGATMHQEAIR